MPKRNITNAEILEGMLPNEDEEQQRSIVEQAVIAANPLYVGESIEKLARILLETINAQKKILQRLTNLEGHSREPVMDGPDSFIDTTNPPPTPYLDEDEE